MLTLKNQKEMNFLNIIAFFVTVALMKAAPLEDNSKNGQEIRIGDIVYKTDPSKNANLNVRKWTNGIVPYTFKAASLYTAAEKATIVSAMRSIEASTVNCIKFKERTTEADYLVIESGDGCWSALGRSGGAQALSLLKNGCLYKDTITHELMHALGIHHEHQRSDRDSYVKILYQNLLSWNLASYDKVSAANYATFGFAYDFYSVMHYEYKSDTKNGQATIQPISSSVVSTLMGKGNYGAMTALDAKKVNRFYGCPY